MSHAEAPAIPDFEIDHPADYAPYFLKSPREIGFYLNRLSKRNSLVTAHIDDGQQFFLTSLLADTADRGLMLLDPPQNEAMKFAALKAKRLTLVANLDRVKIQVRLAELTEIDQGGQKLLAAPVPATMLRLQRREFFRLEPPITQPVVCTVSYDDTNGVNKVLELKVADISGGGLSLHAPTELSDDFPPEVVFGDCRLDIPGEGVLNVTLQVRKTVEISAQNGQHILRVGCEFVRLSGARQAMIERYITRIERERKAKETGLAD